MRAVATALLFAALAQAVIVDRVAVSINRQVITDAQVIEDVRLQAFIEGVPVDLSLDNKRKAADRLVDQLLIRRELEFTRFAGTSEGEIAPVLKTLEPRFGELSKYGVSIDDVKRHIAWTLTLLRFIEFRFQPSVQISAAQLRQEYERQLRDHPSLAPFEQVQGDIEKIVRQRIVDSALDRWLGEVRTQNTIIYHGEYKL